MYRLINYKPALLFTVIIYNMYNFNKDDLIVETKKIMWDWVRMNECHKRKFQKEK